MDILYYHIHIFRTAREDARWPAFPSLTVQIVVVAVLRRGEFGLHDRQI